MLADEGFDGGGAVHVSDGDDELAGAEVLELLPAFEGLVEICHVGHGAAGAEVGEDDFDVGGGEDVSGFGHEMDAAENDVFDRLLLAAAFRESSKLSPMKSANSMTGPAGNGGRG